VFIDPMKRNMKWRRARPLFSNFRFCLMGFHHEAGDLEIGNLGIESTEGLILSNYGRQTCQSG
jgi:hypothetical protein